MKTKRMLQAPSAPLPELDEFLAPYLVRFARAVFQFGELLGRHRPEFERNDGLIGCHCRIIHVGLLFVCCVFHAILPCWIYILVGENKA